MKLSRLMLKDVLHRRRKVAHAALGVVIGVMTVITTLTVAYAAEHRLHAELERYGPNLTVSPATENLAMSMGSLSLGSVTVGENHMPQETVGTIQRLADDAIRRDMGLTGPGPIATVASRLTGTCWSAMPVRPRSMPTMAVGYRERAWTIRRPPLCTR